MSYILGWCASIVVASFPACENDFDISHAIYELSREEGQHAERRPLHFSELLRISCCSVCNANSLIWVDVYI